MLNELTAIATIPPLAVLFVIGMCWALSKK